nr:PREDICTED: uncharacterized protein LOC106482691 [Apteryx mantelli mantelli]
MEGEASARSQPEGGHPGTQDHSRVGHQELPAATQRSQSPAESHQDGLPLLPCTPSPPASGHSSTKRDGMAERTRGIQSTQGFIFASRETAESIASGEIQGGPAYKEQDECLPTHPAALRLPQPPTRVDFANVFRETCHELKSRKLPAPKDTSAREAKAQSLVKAARSCDLVFHSGDLQLPELQAPLTVMPILTTKATPFAEILAEHSSETPEEADTGRTRFAQGILGDPGMAARAECQGPALPATALEDTIQQLVTAAWSHANDASPGPSWQLVQPNADKTMEERRVAVAQGLVAHTNGPVAPASRVLEQTMKPESAEELNSSCLIRTEQSLAQLRKLHLWRKKSQKEREVKEQEGEGKRFTLTMSGRLNVKPKEVFCRNSFPNLWEPELTRVELLKDVTTKQDLMERLVVHSVKKEQSMRAEQRGLRAPKGVELEVVAEEDDDDEDANEDILKVEDSLLICKRRLHIMMNRQEERRHAWIPWGPKKKASTCTIWARPSFLSKDTSTRTYFPKIPHPSHRMLCTTPAPTEAWPVGSRLARGLWHQVAHEHVADESSSFTDTSEDDSGMFTDTPASWQWPSILRTALRAVCRALSCSCDRRQ